MQLDPTHRSRSPGSDETDADRLGGLLADDALSLDLVSAFAGDRQLSSAESRLMLEMEARHGQRFYCDLLYAITHQYFAPETARDTWREVLHHKYMMSDLLGRNVRIAVASLDYLANFTDQMPSATVIGEDHIADIVRLSQRDGLTGLHTHAFLFQKLKMDLSYQAVVSVLMIDIDHFKEINDEFGHQEGDRVLAALAATVGTVARTEDSCCRYGGDELAMVLPETQGPEAAALAGRLHEHLACHPPSGRPVTVSVGIASSSAAVATAELLIEKADEALYQAKKEGRNRTVVLAS